MTTEKEKKTRQMPKGGRKGGSTFPRIALDDSLNYARKLVSKTHTGPQPRDVIYSGVVGAKAGLGNVRISALKQYGFLSGDAKSNFSADDLAKKIAAAPAEELVPLYRQAILKPTVFKKLFDTFHGDTVSKAKLKQRAADLKVHPDETATCVDLYVSGMTTARLVTVEGDQVKHVASSDIATGPNANTQGDAQSSAAGEQSEEEDLAESQNSADETAVAAENEKENSEAVSAVQRPSRTTQSSPRAVFNVNVTLDSSLDIEKLQKQLELLKRFGAI